MADAPIETPRRLRNIADLAAIAGVSPGTVSRALSGSGQLGAKTRERIQALAREHGFRPNLMARNLRIQRTGAIGVVIPLGHDRNQHISDPFFMAMIGHLADALTERGYDLLLSRVIPNDGEWLDRIVDSGRVDGVVVIGQSDQSATLDRVATRYRPLVVWGGNAAGQAYCTVGTDNRLGGRLAAQHLVERGAKRIAFLGDPRAFEIGQRLEGAREALAAAGLDLVATYPSHLSQEEAQPEAARFLDANLDRIDGIVAASDIIAMSAIRALAERGIDVPGRVRVTGYDDIAISAQTNPPLTTIRQDLAIGASKLADLLLRAISGETIAPVVLAPELVVRGSS